MLCPKTWPHWHGPPQEGVKNILAQANVTADKFEYGRSKIFIRNPKTVIALIMT